MLADTLPHPVCLTHSLGHVIRPLVHSSFHSFIQSVTLSPHFHQLAFPLYFSLSSLPVFPQPSSILPLHTYLCHVLLSLSTSSPPSLPLSPNLSLPLSLIPVEQESHQAGERLMFPLCMVCRVICKVCSVQQQGVQYCVFLLHGCKQQ